MQSMTKQFLDFCRSKDADEAYPYHNICGCALFQFCKEMGLPVTSCGATDWADDNRLSRLSS